MSTGILIIVGGPQYRVGSHRQFVSAARAFASNGYPTMRFDHRGMGDSEGDIISFDSIGPDIKAAIDSFMNVENNINGLILWGLCDAASAISQYAYHDERVKGIVLLNPWTRTDASLARAYVKHYYSNRIFQKEFWNKVLEGKLEFKRAAASFINNICKTINLNFWKLKNSNISVQKLYNEDDSNLTLPDKMLFRAPKILR